MQAAVLLHEGELVDDAEGEHQSGAGSADVVELDRHLDRRRVAERERDPDHGPLRVVLRRHRRDRDRRVVTVAGVADHDVVPWFVLGDRRMQRFGKLRRIAQAQVEPLPCHRMQ